MLNTLLKSRVKYRAIFMINKIFSKINLTLNFVNSTIYLYPLLIGLVILYLSYRFSIGQYGMGLAFALGSIFYYVLRNKFGVETLNSINLTARNYNLFLILNITFLVSFSLSLIALHYSVYIRPTLYFFLVTISFFCIFIEIFNIKQSNFDYILILKIIIVSLSLRIGRFFNYPSIPGSDTHFHLNLAKSIIKNGAVPHYSMFEENSYYSYSSLSHIFEAINGIVLNVNLKYMLLFSVVISSTIIISLFLYCIVKKMYNSQTALVAVLFINITDMLFVQNVTNINPGSIVYCFFLVIMFCIIQQKNESTYSFIVVAMILCMILSHQLSTTCVLLILLTLLISNIIYKAYFINITKTDLDPKDLGLNLSLNTLTYFIIIMIFYWSLMGLSVGDTFFDKMVYRLNSTIISMINEYLTKSSAPPTPYENLFSGFSFYSNLLYNIGSNFLLMLAVIGILLAIAYRYKSLITFSYIYATFMLFGLIYAGTYIGLGYLFIPHRLLPFLQLFLVIFASFSTYHIYIITSQRWIRSGLMIVVMLLIFFMLTTPYINRGDAIYSTDMVYRDQYTYSELKSLEWSNHFLENQKLLVDSAIYSRPLSTIDTLNISSTQINTYNPESYENSKNILIREYIVTNPDLKVGGTFGMFNEQNYQELFTKASQEYNLVYSSSSARIYQNQNNE